MQLIPEGSPGIERALVAALESNGETPEDMAFDGRSDYDSFTRAGIPSGNMDTGADEPKSAQQVAEWSGQEGKPCDPNYHSPDDTIANVNRDALGEDRARRRLRDGAVRAGPVGPQRRPGPRGPHAPRPGRGMTPSAPRSTE